MNRGPGRARWWLAAAVTSLVIGCALLTVWLWKPLQTGAARATVLVLPVSVAMLVAAIVSAWLAWRALHPSPAADHVAGDLARAVGEERQLFLDQALGVSWRAELAHVTFADPAPGILAPPAESLLLHWQDVDGAEVGSIDSVADFYKRLESQRLVVLGAPGSGKTVLLSKLVMDLIGRPDDPKGNSPPMSARVPVLLSLPACDLGDVQDSTDGQIANRLYQWITAQLVEGYGLRPSAAATLVDGGRVLPILDGLDEMDPSSVVRPKARAVLQALNLFRRPVVVASRQVDYFDLAKAGGQSPARPPVLSDARHVTLRPLKPEDIVGWLTDRFRRRDRGLQQRWEPLARAVMDGHPVGQVLANPWQLFLAVTAYSSNDTDPAELLSLRTDETESRLLENLIPAVVEHDKTAAVNRWTADQVRRWLTTIANHQHRSASERGKSMTDIRLPDLWRVGDSRYTRWVPAFVSAATFGALGIAFAWTAVSSESWPAGMLSAAALIVACAAWWFSIEQDASLQRLDVRAVRTPRGRRRLTDSLASGLRWGLTVGLTVGLSSALTVGLSALVFGLVIMLVIVLAVGLVFGLAATVEIAPSPSILAKQCASYSVAVGLASGLVFGLVFGLPPPDLVGGLPFGLGAGLAFGLDYGNGSIWLRYVLGMNLAARRGLMPHRAARFFDWALGAGLLRMAGVNMQFRHRQLQDLLTRLSPDERRIIRAPRAYS